MARRDNKDTDPHNDALGGELGRSQESLLGSKPLDAAAEDRFLLRLDNGSLKDKFAGYLKTQDYKPNLTHAQNGKVPPLVLGPFNKSDITHFVEEGWLSADDTLLKSFDRWRGIANFFPELRAAFGELEDVTATSTASASGLGFDEATDKNIVQELPPPKVGGEDALPSLEVENFDNFDTTQVSVTPTASQAQNTRAGSRQAGNNGGVRSGQPGLQRQVMPPRRDGAQLPAAVPMNTQVTLEELRRAKRAPVMLFIAAAVLLIAIVFFIQNKPSQNAVIVADTQHQTSLAANPPKVVTAENWPENLKPRNPAEAFKDEDFLVAKIRPILNAYEKGITVLSAEDEKTLKGFAQEGTASWEARRLASNQLAIYYLSTERPAEARAILQPISKAGNPDDYVTPLNLALISLVEGNSAMAKELADIGLRLSPRGIDWIANSIVGMIEGASGKLGDATQSFKSALNLSTNNPFIYGIWIQNLYRGTPKPETEIPQLIHEALWADPDRLIDSPIRAPLAGHILLAEALDGFRKGAERAESKLTSGQSSFFRWLEARSRLNPVSQPLSQVMETLSSENAVQSQLLYAYSLKEQGRIEEASEVMSRVIPLLEVQGNFASSWPWTLAGDLQMARKQVSQALVLYQGALKRNQRDVSAVHGLAMAFRAQGSYTDAQQKLSEAISLDPSFIPAILRIERLDWQRRGMAQ